ncbi:hypothetical protein I4F81_001624 [Pyropia yezoensis]|uniref:Uncharacterized protein n=1 Tax=Pyropia yezoensis TaxID=2788 RepID=A0ACC3BNF9_PYRYE|nr:hypothetical protein I4F81_001624 [Neopyropia yezoensis]
MRRRGGTESNGDGDDGGSSGGGGVGGGGGGGDTALCIQRHPHDCLHRHSHYGRPPKRGAVFSRRSNTPKPPTNPRDAAVGVVRPATRPRTIPCWARTAAMAVEGATKLHSATSAAPVVAFRRSPRHWPAST